MNEIIAYVVPIIFALFAGYAIGKYDGGKKVYPTKFEAYEGPECCDSLFRVEAFDEGAATVHIDTVVNVDSWDEIAAEVRKCLVAMELT